MLTIKNSSRMFAPVWVFTLVGVFSVSAVAPPVTQGLKVHYDASDVNAGSNPSEGAPVTTWHDISGNAIHATTTGLTVPAVSLTPPIYHTNALNGRGGVDFSGSNEDGLASAFSSLLDFTNATIFVVANRSDSGTRVVVSGPTLSQEFNMYDHGIYHHAAAFHWSRVTHSSPPASTDFFIAAGIFGTHSNELANIINGVLSSNSVQYSVDFGQQPGVADFVTSSRQVVLGWRNAKADGSAPLLSENFAGTICEVLVYDRKLTLAEVDRINAYCAEKYAISVTIIPPAMMAQPASPGSVELSWETTTGRFYQLQSSTNLALPAWQDEGAAIPGSGQLTITNFPIGSAPQKFFRLMISN